MTWWGRQTDMTSTFSDQRHVSAEGWFVSFVPLAPLSVNNQEALSWWYTQGWHQMLFLPNIPWAKLGSNVYGCGFIVTVKKLNFSMCDMFWVHYLRDCLCVYGSNGTPAPWTSLGLGWLIVWTCSSTFISWRFWSGSSRWEPPITVIDFISKCN